MKTKLRNIMVNNQHFVYWYSGGERFVLYITPKIDKNIKIELIFESTPPEKLRNSNWAFYEILAVSNHSETTISIAMPKFISEAISYLLSTQKELFVERKIHIINVMELLEEMGYSELKPKWIPEW